MTKTNSNLQALINTISTLRSDQGCPWDKRQTPDSILKYLNSETEELITAIENNDTENTCEELGDVLYLLIMIATYYNEKGIFDFSTVIQTVNEKLIRRHPHVFAGKTYKDEADLDRQWQEIKSIEKQKKLI
ncbi:MAG: tetrapyrrole methylase family protein/MazG family protein [Desulforhopalus sp.]|jgi:tetrapyrrole methylase family protein/MazG family protein